MAEQEQIFDLQRRVAGQEAHTSNLDTKFEMFMGEMRDFKTEMRQQNEMRAAENRDLSKHFQSMYWGMFIGFAALIVSIWLK